MALLVRRKVWSSFSSSKKALVRLVNIAFSTATAVEPMPRMMIAKLSFVIALSTAALKPSRERLWSNCPAMFPSSSSEYCAVQGVGVQLCASRGCVQSGALKLATYRVNTRFGIIDRS